MLQDFMDAFDLNSELENLLLDLNIKKIINSHIESARKVSIYSIENENVFYATSLFLSLLFINF